MTSLVIILYSCCLQSKEITSQACLIRLLSITNQIKIWSKLKINKRIWNSSFRHVWPKEPCLQSTKDLYISKNKSMIPLPLIATWLWQLNCDNQFFKVDVVLIKIKTTAVGWGNAIFFSRVEGRIFGVFFCWKPSCCLSCRMETSIKLNNNKI